ncbi:MAG TPA: hypothetical protein VEJ18_18175, partial [Planctomycetota bacterium]|nr:hypothetical protein [Planctomycetota bacterium]
MTPYLREPLTVLTERELRRASPDWLMIVDVNAVALRAWLSEEYEIVFRKPSTRGELEIHRRRRR